MPNLGAPEIIIILVLALLVFGPKRLPEIGRSLGRTVRELKNATQSARKEFGVDEIEREINDVKKTVTDVKGDLKIDIDKEAARPGKTASVAAAGAAAAGAAAAEAAAAPAAEETLEAGAEAAGTPAEADQADHADDAGDEVLVGEIVDNGTSGDQDGDAPPDEGVAGEPAVADERPDGV